MNRQRGATKFETLLLMLIILLLIFLVIPIYNSVMDKSPVTHSTEKQSTDLRLLGTQESKATLLRKKSSFYHLISSSSSLSSGRKKLFYLLFGVVLIFVLLFGLYHIFLHYAGPQGKEILVNYWNLIRTELVTNGLWLFLCICILPGFVLPVAPWLLLQGYGRRTRCLDSMFGVVCHSALTCRVGLIG